MTMTFRQVRIAQLGVEASAAAIDRKASGPLGGIGSSLGYEDLFLGARAGGAAAALPWSGKGLRSNRFWKKYVTGLLSRNRDEDWPGIAWQALVPLKAAAPVPSLSLHPGDTRRYAEAFVWPTGFGLCWNNWIEADLDQGALLAILGKLRQSEVDWTTSGGASGKSPMQTLYHTALGSVGNAAWGTESEGVRSERLTVITIVSAAVSGGKGSTGKALAGLLDGLQQVWGYRPRILEGDCHAEGGQTVYAAKGLRLVWIPDAFLAKGPVHRCGCLHRNVIAASLQVELLAATARLLAEARPARGSLPPAYSPFVQRVLERIDFFLSDRGYCAPFLSALLETGAVRDARKALAKA